MSERKTNCKMCGARILLATANRTGGVCMPCSKEGFKVKRQGDWFWSVTNYGLGEIQEKYDSQDFDDEHLVCPAGNKRHVVNIRKFLESGVSLVPASTTPSQTEPKQTVSQHHSEASPDTSTSNFNAKNKGRASKIFISYRRSDTVGVAGRIYDRFTTELGSGSVFMDVDNIPLGADFRRYLIAELEQCCVVLVLIGNEWCGGEARRIDDPSDPVRVEVETALKLDRLIIPILIGDARMPSPESLPESVAPLSFRNGMKLDPGPDFHSHMTKLMQKLGKVLRKANS